MVAIHSLASLLAMTLMVNAAPAELVTRGDPGSSAGQARFFAAGNTKCDQGGQAIVQADFFYPPAPKGNTGIIVNVATGSCNAIGPYGSVVIDFLQPGCVCKSPFLRGMCCMGGMLTVW